MTEGGEAIEAPIVPGSEMLALMLTAFLTFFLHVTDPQISVIGCERGFADDEYHINIQYQQKLIRKSLVYARFQT